MARSHTIIVSEDTGRGGSLDGQWANGENIFLEQNSINIQQNNEMWSDHPGGVNVLFCDGSVHFLAETMPVELLAALCTRACGEIIDTDAAGVR